LSGANYTASIGVFKSDEIKPIDEEKGGGGAMMRGIVNNGVNSSSDDGQYYAQLFGYNFTPEEFTNGSRKIAEGRFPENDGECILSRDLLSNSGLNIGDTITLKSSLREIGSEMPLPGEERDDSTDLQISYTLKIVGFYDDVTDEYANDFMQNAYFNRRNEIITTLDTVISQIQDGYSGISVGASYYLKNPDMLDSFASELYAKGLDHKFDVTTDEGSYNAIVKPVLGLKGITYVFLGVVLILGAVILILLSSIAIRERKYEIGVLRAMGMKKNKVAAGLLTEIITIAVVCLILGLGTGIMAAQPISDMLLQNQLEQLESESGDTAFGPGVMRPIGGAAVMGAKIGGSGMRSPAEALKEMDVNLNGLTIVEIICISLLLAIAASIAGITHITKYEPIKILSDRT
jgi:putative ABC transport system permease protein